MYPPKARWFRPPILVACSTARSRFGSCRPCTRPTPAKFAFPAVRIVDAPRLRWRGLLLDSARQYQSVAFIKRYIDFMALHKLNVLHWHLVDDRAWRLQIPKYPKLTGGMSSYSADDVREVSRTPRPAM